MHNLSRRQLVKLCSLGFAAMMVEVVATEVDAGKPPAKPHPPKPHPTTTTSVSSTSTTSTTVPATSSTTSTSTSTTSTVPPSTVTPKNFGAVGDGVADDTAALQRAFDSGQPISLGGFTFRHTAVVIMRNAGGRLTGPGTLLATVPSQEALRITAANVTVDGVILKANVIARLAAPQESRLWLDHCVGTTISNVTVQGSASAGCFVYGASNYLFDKVTVNNSLSDAFHNTMGSHDGVIRDCVVNNSGDDGFAVVSYVPDGSECYNIRFENPKFYGQTWGRGFSVVGGHDITFTNIYGQDSAGAMMYFACEGNPYYTYPARNVTVEGGTILRANQNASIGHGAVVLTCYNGSFNEDAISINNVTITDTRAGAPRQVGLLATAPATITHVTLTNIHIVNGPTNILQADAAVTYNSSGWTFNGNAVAPHTGW